MAQAAQRLRHEAKQRLDHAVGAGVEAGGGKRRPGHRAKVDELSRSARSEGSSTASLPSRALPFAALLASPPSERGSLRPVRTCTTNAPAIRTFSPTLKRGRGLARPRTLEVDA